MYLVKYQLLLTSIYSFLTQLREHQVFLFPQFATEVAIIILRIDDMIKLIKDESQNAD